LGERVGKRERRRERREVGSWEEGGGEEEEGGGEEEEGGNVEEAEGARIFWMTSSRFPIGFNKESLRRAEVM
jgi:hypothetical protein